MNKHFWNKVYDYLANYRYYKLNNNKYQIQQMLKNDNELETFVDEYNKNTLQNLDLVTLDHLIEKRLII